MADKQNGEDPRKPSLLKRGLFRPYGAFSDNPIKIVWRDLLSAYSNTRQGFAQAKEALSRDHRAAPCQNCGQPGRAILVEATQLANGDYKSSYRCENCGHISTKTTSTRDISRVISVAQRQERILTAAAAAITGAGFVYFFFSGYLPTLICTVVISALLMANAIFMRFYAWKAAHPTLQENSHWREWLREELKSSKTEPRE